MTAVKDYRDLIVWQKAMDLVETDLRDTTGTFPREEIYGLNKSDSSRCHLYPIEHRGRKWPKYNTRLPAFPCMAYGSLRKWKPKSHC